MSKLFHFVFVNEVIHVDNGAVLVAQAGLCVGAVGDPILEGKVNRLSTVESEIEARMIRLREGDNDFALALHNCVDSDTVSFEQ